MIDEESLKVAAEEVANAMLLSLPDDVLIQYVPSTVFKKKMNKLLFRVKHPGLYCSIRYVASFLVTILLSTVLILSVSEKARATALGWIKELKEEYIQYEFECETTISISDTRYQTTWLPEGYKLLQYEQVNDGGVYIYVDEQNYIAQLTYICNPTEGDVNLLMDGNKLSYEYFETEVMGYKADMFISKDDTHTNSIIWNNEDNTLFYMSAMLAKEELIKWAESVTKFED